MLSKISQHFAKKLSEFCQKNCQNFDKKCPKKNRSSVDFFAKTKMYKKNQPNAEKRDKKLRKKY
jgi:hypothetical protein